MGRTLALRASCVLWAAAWLCAGPGPSRAAAQDQTLPPGLRVRPTETIELFAVQGQEGARGRAELTLANRERRRIDWRIRSDRSWLEAVESKGSLRIREQTQVQVRVVPERLAELSPGLHEARLHVVNSTSDQGTTSLRVRLHLRGDAGLRAVVDSVGQDPTGASRLNVRLVNQGQASIEWSASAAERWLVATPREGTLAAGDEQVVHVGVAERMRPRLGGMRRRAAMAFVNRGDGSGTTLLPFDVDNGRFVLEPDATGDTAGDAQDEQAPVERRDQLSQFGITWTLDRPYPVGRFANGDWWVQGPCLLVGITPGVRTSDGRTRNGSMLNPVPRGLAQGYDSAMYAKYASPGDYDPGLNVDVGLGWQQPLVLPVDSSLVSTISDPRPDQRPQLETAAILTVLPAPAPRGSFRPAYCGADKRLRHHVEDLDLSLLERLSPVASAPPLAEVERMFERPWIDHVVGWFGRYMHPRANMPDYGREMTDQVGTAALMLHLDLPEESKRTLLVRFVQLGIDLYGILEAGGSWPPSAGHLNGRKWPILFAGLMLGDDGMAGIGHRFGPETFSEDGQTFYVPEGHRGLGYRSDQVGLAEWGTAHALRAELDDPRWQDSEPPVPGRRVRRDLVPLRTQNVKYRLCCTSNAWWGQLLAARIMGAVDLWGHPALFDYQDRFLAENEAAGIQDYRLSWTPFGVDMWRRYRADY